MNKLGEYILTALKAEHISQKELADGVHLSSAQISRIINGTRGADVVTVGKIAVFLRRRPEELFRMAGHLPPISSKSALVERVEYIVENYKHPETKARALEYLEFLRVQEEKGSYETKRDREHKESLTKALGG